MSATGAVLSSPALARPLFATRSLPDTGWPAFPGLDPGTRPGRIQPGRDGRLLLAMGLTVLLGAVAAALLPRLFVPPPMPVSVEVVIEPAAPKPFVPELPTPEALSPAPAEAVAPAVPPAISPEPPPPLTQPVAPAQPMPRRQPPPSLAQPAPRPAPKPRPAPTATKATPAPAPGPAPAVGASAAPATPAGPNPGEVAAFQASMRQAVRAALIYPPAARMAGQKGEVRVAFDYLDGMASNVALGASSGLPLLDRAAVATVQAAHYGPPPATLSHRAMHLSILVRFDPDQ